MSRRSAFPATSDYSLSLLVISSVSGMVIMPWDSRFVDALPEADSALGPTVPPPEPSTKIGHDLHETVVVVLFIVLFSLLLQNTEKDTEKDSEKQGNKKGN